MREVVVRKLPDECDELLLLLIYDKHDLRQLPVPVVCIPSSGEEHNGHNRSSHLQGSFEAQLCKLAVETPFSSNCGTIAIFGLVQYAFQELQCLDLARSGGRLPLTLRDVPWRARSQRPSNTLASRNRTLCGCSRAQSRRLLRLD
jgi:hypothetical protein